MMGKGSINHNTRAFSAKNVDVERSIYNVEFCHAEIEEVYHELFDEALERYNAKQKRNDRKIDNYYEKIRQGKPYQCPFFISSQSYLSEDFIELSDSPGFTFIKIFIHIPSSPLWLFYHNHPPLVNLQDRNNAMSILFATLQIPSPQIPYTLDNIETWADMYQKFRNEEITEKEYLDWKSQFPAK